MTVASSSKASWPSRRAVISQALTHESIQSLLTDLSADPAVADAIRRAYQSAVKGKAKAQDDEDLALELAMAASWTTSFNRLPPLTVKQLRSVGQATLAPNDFPSVTALQRSSAAYVEIVRARFDRQLYVLKTVIKGIARRESNRCNPGFEAQLLAEGQKVNASRRPVPDFVASFQSQNSLHIVMQYFPAGDLDQLLHSAGEAGIGNALGRNGGLIDEEHVKLYAADIVAAVAWCHEQGFAHRDIKPANFLLERNGHLKLCDFATAAPFGTFDGGRRRVHHAYSCLAGTADYMAPDILLGEEARLNSLAARKDRWGPSFAGMSDDQSFSAYASFSRSQIPNYRLPAVDSEGFYGPEVDWWSVGIVLYEMVFRTVPFWSESIREAHHRIRNHEQFLRLDARVPISATLEGLIRSFLCDRQARLGASSDGTRAVKQHAFFQGIDWDNYLDAPAPFVPNIEVQADSDSPASPSVLHSPAFMARRQMANPADDSISMTPESIRLSQIFDGDIKDFPAFMDSRDQEEMQLAAEDTSAQNSHTVLAPVTNEQPTWSHTPSESLEFTAPLQWSDLDTLWLGFSKSPAADAFGPLVPKMTRLAALPAATPMIPRLRSFSVIMEASPACSSAAASPEVWMKNGGEGDAPFSSTPYARGGYSSPAVRMAQPTPPPMSIMTPYSTAPKSLQRRAIEVSSRWATPGDGRFVTPLRKASMPNIASAFRNNTLPVTASPYPFPMAARVTSNTPDPRRIASLASQEVTDSQSPQGSDSRCSGGSNVKRECSESEAMEQLAKVVAQSARKSRVAFDDRSVHERLAALEKRLGQKPSSAQRFSIPTRPHLVHSVTDTVIAKSNASQQHAGSEGEHNGQIAARRRVSVPPRSATAQGMMPASQSAPGLLSLAASDMSSASNPVRRPSSSQGKAKPLAPSFLSGRLMAVRPPPLLNLPPPSPVSALAFPTPSSDSEPESPLTSRPGSALGYLGRHERQTATSAMGDRKIAGTQRSMSSSQDLRPPRMGAPTLRTRRSDRQLKLQAQERTTPTRPTRANSPLLQTEFNIERLSLEPPTANHHREDSTPSLTDSADSESSASVDSLQMAQSAARLGGFGAGAAGHTHTFSVSSPHAMTTRLSAPPTTLEYSRIRATSHSQLAKSRLGLPLPGADAGIEALGEDQQRTRTLRRKDSRETLSEYRNGIVHGMSPPTGTMAFPAIESPEEDPEDAFGGSVVAPLKQKFAQPMAGNGGRGLRRVSATNMRAQFGQMGSAVGSSGDRTAQSQTSEQANGAAKQPRRRDRLSQQAAPPTGSSAGSSKGTRRRSPTGTNSARPLSATAAPNARVQPLPLSASLAQFRPRAFYAIDENSAVEANASPLTKMDHRFGSLQTSFEGLEARITNLKARLQQ